MSRLASISRAVARLELQHAAAAQNAAQTVAQLAQLQQEYADALEARTVAQSVAVTAQTQAAKPIIDIVTRCLAAVFPDPYTFDVVFESRRGKTEVDLVFRRNGYDVTPIGGAGGGAVEVAAFALRLAVLLLSRPPVQRVLILDEPFAFVRPPDDVKLWALLDQLVAEMGLQIIQIIAPSATTAVGHVIRINNRTQESEDVESK